MSSPDTGIVAPPRRFPSIRALIGLQSSLFEGLAEWLFARGYLVKAGELDDLESACERRGFALLSTCKCGAGPQAAAWFRKADRYDRAERYEGYALAGERFDLGAAHFRGTSTQVDAMVVVVGKGRVR